MYWTTTDIAKAMGVKRQTAVDWIRNHPDFPPPDIQISTWFGWDPGREAEIRKWRDDRDDRNRARRHTGAKPVPKRIPARRLPPAQRQQALTDQQIKLQGNGFIALPADRIKLGDVRPWGGVVNRIGRTKTRHMYIIHDDILGASKSIGGKGMVMIQPRPVSDDG
jgi:hypothetical protein